MIRRFAGWLMGFFPDEKPTPKVPFACAIGWHRLRLMRISREYVFACARPGCPTNPRSARTFLSNATTESEH